MISDGFPMLVALMRFLSSVGPLMFAEICAKRFSHTIDRNMVSFQFVSYVEKATSNS